MRLKPLPLRPLYRHKTFSESVSIHSYIGSAGAAAIRGWGGGEKGKKKKINSSGTTH